MINSDYVTPKNSPKKINKPPNRKPRRIKKYDITPKILDFDIHHSKDDVSRIDQNKIDVTKFKED